MRYSRMREWLSRSNRDMRNPYGSRGGYVVSDRRGMNYGYDRMGDMARGRGYDRRYSDRNYSSSDYQMDSMANQYDREYGRDNASRRAGYFDYTTQDGNYDMNYGHDMNYDYGYDMARYRDYGESEYKLTPSEIRKWEKGLESADGTKGAKFQPEQVKQVAQSLGIDFKEFSPELLSAVTNSLYSDYCKILGSDIVTYVKLAKAFLMDDDFDGEPEEKAYLYYTSIVDKE